MPFAEFLINHPWIVTYLTAELACILLRTDDIKILVKKNNQRTTEEKTRIDRGLCRAFFLDFFFFVNASATLMLLILSPYFLIQQQESVTQEIITKNSTILTWYGLLGIASYGFPFATIRRYAQRMALKTLSEFHNIVNAEHSENNTNTEHSKEK